MSEEPHPRSSVSRNGGGTGRDLALAACGENTATIKAGTCGPLSCREGRRSKILCSALLSLEISLEINMANRALKRARILSGCLIFSLLLCTAVAQGETLTGSGFAVCEAGD